MTNFPITETRLTGLFLESIFFGIHLITFGYCMQALISRRTNMRLRKSGHSSSAMLVASLFLFVNATFDISLLFYHTLKAFVFYHGPGGATEELTNVSEWINVIGCFCTVAQAMVGDGTLIYRCWVVYGGRWSAIAFSIILWCGCSGSGIWLIYLESIIHSKVLLSAKELQPAEILFWGLTGAVNIVTTGLIVWRIWAVDRDSKGLRVDIRGEWGGYQSHLQRIIRILMDSGLLYTATAFTTFVTFIVGSTIAYVVTDAEIQIVGIAFNLIIIRASRLSERPDGTIREPEPTMSFSAAPGPSGTFSGTPETTRYYPSSRSDVESIEQ